MKVLIPMAGQGKRFVRAGYDRPKPLIEVDGKPMIAHVIANFSGGDDFVFGVNEEHRRSSDLEFVLKDSAPRGVIVPMPYQPGGVIDVLERMMPHVRDDEPVIVNYCDFSWVWDYPAFLRTVADNRCDGAVACYTGFHPHLLGPNRYATLDADGRWMKEIREKHSWHGDKTKDWTSSGTYYFRTGAMLKAALQKIRRKDWKISGEYYASQLMQILKEDGGKVFIFEIPFMLQWGTPEDLEDYRHWSDTFRAIGPAKRPPQCPGLTVLMLAAGAGRRFADAGYQRPKPFIDVDGEPMVVRAAESLPRGSRYLFIAMRDHLETDPSGAASLKKKFPPAELISIEKITEGQASTALLAEDRLDPEAPLLIGACDHGVSFDTNEFAARTVPGAADALIFTHRGHPPARSNPSQYGWVKVDGVRAVGVSVKTPPAHPEKDPIIVGAFWFRKARTFLEGAKRMIAEGSRVNGEFYIDRCMEFLIRDGLNVETLDTTRYVSWGTPGELKTYEYWSRYFGRAA